MTDTADGPAAPSPALTRRAALGLAGGVGLGVFGSGEARGAPAPATAAAVESVAEFERRYGNRIGLAAVNRRTGAAIRHRADERFPLLSTFKVLAVSAVLHRDVDLDHVVRYRTADVVDNSPVTGQRREMTYAELADAALRFSDNTAGNLLLRRIGGPAGLTRWVRRIGDRTTRLDRWETDLNSAVPGDPRDTTTPAAILATYTRLLFGDVLGTRDRWLLRAWMEANTTSVGKFRAGLPAGWWFADKTGGGAYGTMNDVGLITAPDGTEIMVAILTRTDRPDAVGNPQLMTDLARWLVDRLT